MSDTEKKSGSESSYVKDEATRRDIVARLENAEKLFDEYLENEEENILELHSAIEQLQNPKAGLLKKINLYSGAVKEKEVVEATTWSFKKLERNAVPEPNVLYFSTDFDPDTESFNLVCKIQSPTDEKVLIDFPTTIPVPDKSFKGGALETFVLSKEIKPGLIATATELLNSLKPVVASESSIGGAAPDAPDFGTPAAPPGPPDAPDFGAPAAPPGPPDAPDFGAPAAPPEPPGAPGPSASVQVSDKPKVIEMKDILQKIKNLIEKTSVTEKNKLGNELSSLMDELNTLSQKALPEKTNRKRNNKNDTTPEGVKKLLQENYGIGFLLKLKAFEENMREAYKNNKDEVINDLTKDFMDEVEATKSEVHKALTLTGDAKIRLFQQILPSSFKISLVTKFPDEAKKFKPNTFYLKANGQFTFLSTSVKEGSLENSGIDISDLSASKLKTPGYGESILEFGLKEVRQTSEAFQKAFPDFLPMLEVMKDPTTYNLIFPPETLTPDSDKKNLYLTPEKKDGKDLVKIDYYNFFDSKWESIHTSTLKITAIMDLIEEVKKDPTKAEKLPSLTLNKKREVLEFLAKEKLILTENYVSPLGKIDSTELSLNLKQLSVQLPPYTSLSDKVKQSPEKYTKAEKNDLEEALAKFNVQAAENLAHFNKKLDLAKSYAHEIITDKGEVEIAKILATGKTDAVKEYNRFSSSIISGGGKEIAEAEEKEKKETEHKPSPGWRKELECIDFSSDSNLSFLLKFNDSEEEGALRLLRLNRLVSNEKGISEETVQLLLKQNQKEPPGDKKLSLPLQNIIVLGVVSGYLTLDSSYLTLGKLPTITINDIEERLELMLSMLQKAGEQSKVDSLKNLTSKELEAYVKEFFSPSSAVIQASLQYNYYTERPMHQSASKVDNRKNPLMSPKAYQDNLEKAEKEKVEKERKKKEAEENAKKNEDDMADIHRKAQVLGEATNASPLDLVAGSVDIAQQNAAFTAGFNAQLGSGNIASRIKAWDQKAAVAATTAEVEKAQIEAAKNALNAGLKPGATEGERKAALEASNIITTQLMALQAEKIKHEHLEKTANSIFADYQQTPNQDRQGLFQKIKDASSDKEEYEKMADIFLGKIAQTKNATSVMPNFKRIKAGFESNLTWPVKVHIDRPKS